MTYDRKVHRALAGKSRVRTLEMLRTRSDPTTVTDLADLTGLHPNTVRFHLQQLVDAGLVTEDVQPRPRRGRPHRVYAAAPHAEATPPEPTGYRALAMALSNHLERDASDPGREATLAGRAWGRDLARSRPDTAGVRESASTDLVELLDDLGFEPRAHPTDDDAGIDIELLHCPFVEVAREHPAVTCGMHLGLMQGVLDETNSPLQATRLNPFVTPGVCLAHVEATGAEPTMPVFELTSTPSRTP